MKFFKKHKTLAAIFLIATLCVISTFTVVYAVNVNDVNKTDNTLCYQYPLDPINNSAEWAKLSSYQEKIEVCQLPEDEISSWTTEELLDVCLAYPMYGTLNFQNSLQQGFDKILNDFNGLKALLERDDLGSVLLQRYETLDLNKILKSQRYPVSYVKFLEITIAQESVLEKMTHDERESLLKIAANVQSKKENYESCFSINENAVIVGRILMIDYPEFREIVNNDEALASFINSANPINSVVDPSIAKEITAFLEDSVNDM